MPRFPRGFLHLGRRPNNLMHRQPAGQPQQARQCAVKVDRKPGLAGFDLFRRDRHQFHLLHQGPQRLLGLVHPLRVREVRDQLADPGAIGLCHARMNADWIRDRGGRELAFQILLLDDGHVGAGGSALLPGGRARASTPPPLLRKFERILQVTKEQLEADQPTGNRHHLWLIWPDPKLRNQHRHIQWRAMRMESEKPGVTATTSRDSPSPASPSSTEPSVSPCVWLRFCIARFDADQLIEELDPARAPGNCDHCKGGRKLALRACEPAEQMTY